MVILQILSADPKLIQFPSQCLECGDIGQRQLSPTFQTLLYPLSKVCGFIFHSTEKFERKSISTPETSQKDNISDPFYNTHVIQSPASVRIRIRYEPTDMFVFKHYALFGLDDTIVPIRSIIPYFYLHCGMQLSEYLTSTRSPNTKRI